MDNVEQLNNEYWTKRSSSYGRQHYQELIDNLDKWSLYVKKNLSNRGSLRCLDVGTGPGFLAIVLSKLGHDVEAIDYNNQMLKQAKQNAASFNAEVKFSKMSALDLQYLDDSFDVVVSRNLTWDLGQPKKAISEWIRVLKPGGNFLNFDANWYRYLNNYQARQKYNLDRVNVSRSKQFDFYKETDIKTMESIAKDLPLTNIIRPDWDVEVLKQLNVTRVEVDSDINQEILTSGQQVNFASTPMFCVKVVK